MNDINTTPNTNDFNETYNEVMKEVRLYQKRLDALKKQVELTQNSINSRREVLDKFSISLYTKVNRASERVESILQTAFDNRNEDVKICSDLYDICKTFVDAIDHYNIPLQTPCPVGETLEVRGRKKIPLLYKGVVYSCMGDLCKCVGISKSTGNKWKMQGKITVMKEV